MDAKRQTTINLVQLLVVIAAVCTATKSTHESDSLLQEETDVSRYSQYCYSCSSDTALCDEVVYDGHFLTAVPCKTSCFLRREDNVTYRGCFDGWLGGMVRNDYVGCRTQVYFGRAVEWCFCNSPASGQDAPCNGQSRDVIAQNAASYGGRQSYPQHSGGYGAGGDRAYVGGQVAKSGYDVYQEEQGVGQYRRREDSSGFKQPIECYSCTDEWSQCQGRIVNNNMVSVTACRTKCFIRKEYGTIYRGCLDGWMASGIKTNYSGCEEQDSPGGAVLWCFCEGSRCNGASLEDMGYVEEPYHQEVYYENRGGAHAQRGGVVDYVYSVPNNRRQSRPSEYKQLPEEYKSSSEGKPVHEVFIVTAAPPDDFPFSQKQGMMLDRSLCRGKRNGFHGDPVDCNHFVQCYLGHPIRQRCPRGTVFDSENNRCDFRWKVAPPCGWQP